MTHEKDASATPTPEPGIEPDGGTAPLGEQELDQVVGGVLPPLPPRPNRTGFTRIIRD